MATAAAFGAYVGLDKPLYFVPEAHAQGADALPGQKLMDKGFHKFKVGDVEVTTIYDGFANAPIDPAFIPGTTADQIKAALVKGGYKGDVRPNFFTVTVVKMKGKTIMFDSSTGSQLAPTAGRMMANNMYAAGIDPQKISAIVVTHYHADHISGMISAATNSKVFPDAEIIVPEVEHNHWNDASLPGKLPEGQRPMVNRIQASLGKWKGVRLAKADTEVLPGIRSVATFGHTPGHTSYLVGSGKNPLLVLGDVTNIPAINVANPDWSIGFDTDKPAAAATRRKIFDRAIAEKLTMTGYHWGMPGAGTVQKDGNGYRYVPVKA
jgi:glyoxylase-like metal-dependent hydrolase (beta-lactamase superfamily II)